MNHSNADAVRSFAHYFDVRLVLGLAGLALPPLVMIWSWVINSDWVVRSSVTQYYTGRTGDAFVGIIIGIALFLIVYKGYEKRDDWAGFAAGSAAIMVAVFPTTADNWEKVVHLIATAVLFIVLTYFCLVLFTKTEKSAPGWEGWMQDLRRLWPFGLSTQGPSAGKIWRKRFYRFAGWLMVLCIVLLAVWKFVDKNSGFGADLDEIHPVFILEWILLWAFALSWLIKSSALAKMIDK